MSGKTWRLAAALVVSGLSAAKADCGPPAGTAHGATPPAPPRYVAGQQGPSGGSGGEYCNTNDLHPAYRLRSISVKSGTTIDSIKLTFDAPLANPNPNDPGIPKEVNCGGTGGQGGPQAPINERSPLFFQPTEHIVRVSGRYGNTVDTLYIQTSWPQFRTYGNKDSTATGTFDFIAPPGTEITALVIKSCTFIDAIGVVLTPLSR